MKTILQAHLKVQLRVALFQTQKTRVKLEVKALVPHHPVIQAAAVNQLILVLPPPTQRVNQKHLERVIQIQLESTNPNQLAPLEEVRFLTPMI